VIAARLQAAGAILAARTTTPELAHSSYTRSPRFGVTRNPWDPSRTPGGSSGGSAVAVATGCVPLAEGSDMGGSIRIPASYCGIVGLKPSFGRIPLEFLPSLTDHIHHVGPLARSVDDARLFLAVTQGPDDRDPLSLPGVLELDRPLSGDVRGLRLALSIDLASYRVHPEVEAAVRRAAEALREAGAEVDEVEVGFTKEQQRAWYAHWGVYLAELLAERLDDYRDQLDPAVLELVERGRAANAVQVRARFNTAVREAWEALRAVHREHAALLCPTMALPPPAAETSAREEDLDMTTLFNLTSPCPALSVPCGFHSDGLPIGLQIVARRHRDDLALRIGAGVERALGGARRPPLPA
jgi:Asp-tRNA(Asn)/Glu-tRNA(Gln) amidotransferase A subunit family amidase